MTAVNSSEPADLPVSTPAASTKKAVALSRGEGRRGAVRGSPLIAAAAAGMLGMLLARLSR